MSSAESLAGEGELTSAEQAELSPMTRMVGRFMRGDVTLLLVVISLLIGWAALIVTPREEEPQIVVPMADVMIEAPGLSAEEVERQVTSRLEKLLYQIDGVQYVYSMSRAGESVVTVRFFVGEDRENALTKLFSKIHSAADEIPLSVSSWVVKPIEIDDVPIVTVSLWSETADYGDFELRRMAEELQFELQGIPDTNRVQVIGGRPRQIRVQLDSARMAAYQTSPLQIADALIQANVRIRSGSFDQQDQRFLVESGEVLNSIEQLQQLVIHVVNGRPVMLGNVAEVLDGPAESTSHSWIGFGPADATKSDQRGQVYPAVHLAVAKRKGSNAVRVADQVHQRMKGLAGHYLPQGVEYRITRDYGQTADAKVNELVQGLLVAVLTVVALIGMTIGWRAALVIALAIPVCYSLTLFVNYLVGYSINRVTMFALILALGLLVDDPITDIENIARYFQTKKMKARRSVLLAVQEVRPALIMSTLAIIISFLPLAFITDMMGPYMAPMALNVPLTVTISTLVAFTITPWLGMMAFRGIGRRSSDRGERQSDRETQETAELADNDLTQTWLYRTIQPFFRILLGSPWRAWLTLGLVAGLLAMVSILPLLRLIPLKILPYDNKNEFQVVIDMEEGTTLERTDLVARRVAEYLSGLAEVRDYQIFVGLASPMDFNGMVRHYFLRNQPHQAEIRINLVDKGDRVQQSHDIILRIRDDLRVIGQQLKANLKIVEVPPGPPVLATITAEVYPPPDASYADLMAVAHIVENRLREEPGVVDVDSSLEADQVLFRFVVDQPKGALSGISSTQVAKTLQAAVGGMKVTALRIPGEVNPLNIELRLPRVQRSSVEQLRQLYVQGSEGQSVQLGEIGQFVEVAADKTIYHKNLRRVAFVYGEIAGVPPANAIIDTMWDRLADDPTRSPQEILQQQTANRAEGDRVKSRKPLAGRTWLQPGSQIPWQVPAGYRVVWNGEGEWKITLDVFRDLGIAFGAALLGIFVLLMFQTGSRVLPLLIMLAIPLTMIGILPGFWLLNNLGTTEVNGHPNPTFFTATAMIGMIALAGIVVRNSIVLIDFIKAAVGTGIPLQQAIVQSVAIRTRPILLTAGTTLLGNWVITLDPVFSGLAWAIIFGLFASTLFTLVVIPVAYWLLYRKEFPD
jgi:multidrug efflux pump subunit AcrB